MSNFYDKYRKKRRSYSTKNTGEIDFNKYFERKKGESFADYSQRKQAGIAKYDKLKSQVSEGDFSGIDIARKKGESSESYFKRKDELRQKFTMSNPTTGKEAYGVSTSGQQDALMKQAMIKDMSGTATSHAGKAVSEEVSKQAAKKAAEEGTKQTAATTAGSGMSAGASAGISIAGSYAGGMIDEGGTTQDTGAGVAGGAVKGASMGAAFGPQGAAVGAVVGGIAGALSARSNRKAAQRKARAEAYGQYHDALANIEMDKSAKINNALNNMRQGFKSSLIRDLKVRL